MKYHASIRSLLIAAACTSVFAVLPAAASAADQSALGLVTGGTAVTLPGITSTSSSTDGDESSSQTTSVAPTTVSAAGSALSSASSDDGDTNAVAAVLGGVGVHNGGVSTTSTSTDGDSSSNSSISTGAIGAATGGAATQLSNDDDADSSAAGIALGGVSVERGTATIHSSSTDGDEGSSSDLAIAGDSLNLGGIGAAGTRTDDDARGAIVAGGFHNVIGGVSGSTSNHDGDEASASSFGIGTAVLGQGGLALLGGTTDAGDDANGEGAVGGFVLGQDGGFVANSSQDGDESNSSTNAFSPLWITREVTRFGYTSDD